MSEQIENGRTEIEIIPAIMPESLEHLSVSLGTARDVGPVAQLDIMDGVFVPEQTWPYTPGGPQEFSSFSSEEAEFPYWRDIDIEVDLMVEHPADVLDDWVQAGAKRLIVHIESTPDFSIVIEKLSQFLDSPETPGGVELGVAIHVDTPVSRIEPFLDRVDFVQCMGIARVGYMGESFDKRVLTQIKEVKELHTGCVVSVDGGVSPETARALVSAGASRLVSGSFIMKSEEPRSATKTLRDAIKKSDTLGTL